jgi:hypothetical protein
MPVVYMIQVGEHGPVKIGWTDDVERRLSGLQTANHERLRVIRLFEGGPAEERMLHKQFASQRLEGEWFTFTKEMLDVVGLPEPKPKPPPAPRPSFEAPQTEKTPEEALLFAKQVEYAAVWWHAHREFRERRSIPDHFAA